MSNRTCAVALLFFSLPGFEGCGSAVRPFESKASHSDAVEGDILCRPGGAPWGVRGSEGILIVASGTCGSCQADIPFEERLWSNAQERAIPVYYVMAERDSNRDRIKELRSGGRSVIAVESLQQFGIARVPTIVRVDNVGRILSKWTGNVLKKDSERVMNSILYGTGLQQYQRISQDEMRKRVARVLARPGSRLFRILVATHSCPRGIIPPAEIYVRARREMNPNLETVIDCTKVRDTLSCQDAALELIMADFRGVAVAGSDSGYSSPCGGRQ